MLCHSARYVLDSYQYVSPILGLLPMILTRGIHIFGPLPKALLTSGTKVNFLHEGWVLLLNLSIRLNVRPLGKKICRCKNRNWFPSFFFVIYNHTRLGTCHQWPSHITQPDTFSKAISLEKHKIQLWWPRNMGFSLVFVGFEIKTHTPPPAKMNHPPSKKKASTRLPIAKIFSGHFS